MICNVWPKLTFYGLLVIFCFTFYSISHRCGESHSLASEKSLFSLTSVPGIWVAAYIYGVQCETDRSPSWGETYSIPYFPSLIKTLGQVSTAPELSEPVVLPFLLLDARLQCIGHLRLIADRIEVSFDSDSEARTIIAGER